MSKAKYFEFQDGKSHKFWEISLSGKSHTVCFGRVGTAGQSKTKTFASAADAKAASEKLIREKTNKGYVAVKSARKQSSAKKSSKSKASRTSATKKRVAKRATAKQKADAKKTASTGRKTAKKSTTKPHAETRSAKKKKTPAVSKSKLAPSDVPRGSGAAIHRLYMLQHDVFEKRRWVGEVVVADFLERDFDQWWKQLDASIKKKGKPLPVIVERHGTSHDFSPVFPFNGKAKMRPMTAVRESGWKRLAPLLGKNVMAVPAVTTRETNPEEFSFSKLDSKHRKKLVLLDSCVKIPFRHGQDLGWNGKAFEHFYGDKKLGNVPMIDPEEIGDVHLFRLEHPVYVVVTQAFVDAYHDAKLTGLKFLPFEYQPTPRVYPPAPKKLLPAMPAYPAKEVRRGPSMALCKKWESMWQWTTTGLKNRSWPAKAFKRKLPVKKSILDAFERKHGIELPSGLRFVLQEYASSVKVDLGWVDSADPLYSYRHELDRHIPNFMFMNERNLWDFTEIEDIETVREGLEVHKEMSPADACCVRILTAGNGDFVTVHLKTEEVRYWSHDGNGSLDRRLGTNLIDFITRWSWIGLPSIEFFPDSAFFDKKKSGLYNTPVRAVKAWHRWLQGHELK